MYSICPTSSFPHMPTLHQPIHSYYQPSQPHRPRRALRARLKATRPIPIRTESKRHLRLPAKPPTARIRHGRTPRRAISISQCTTTCGRWHSRRWIGDSGCRSRRRASGARGEDGFVVWGTDLEGDLGFCADEGAAGIVGGRACGDGLGGAGGGAEGCCWGSSLLFGDVSFEMGGEGSV